MGQDTRKPDIVAANNKDADQPVHLSIMIKCFCYLLPVLYDIASYTIMRFNLVSVAEQAGLSMTWSKKLKTDFFMWRPKL